MNFKIHEGNYEKMGVTRTRENVIFTFFGEKEDQCYLVLIHKVTGELTKIPIPQEYCLGSLRSVAVSGLQIKDYYYYYRINDKETLDDFAPVIAGREIWNDISRAEQDYRVYGAALEERFDWKQDKNPEVRSDQLVIYKLHIRGFTMERRNAKASAGTFRGLEQQIPYLKELGITSVELMPVYEFEEMPVPVKAQIPEYVKWQEDADDLILQQKNEGNKQLNFWGYGPGNYFAVKTSYAREPKRASFEYKHLIRSLHENGMECIMEMFFPKETNHNLILDALRYWVREYHVDGFHLLGENLPITAIVQDVILSRTKIFYVNIPADMQIQKKYSRLYVYKEEYQYPARKLLNHINGNLSEFIDQQKKQGNGYGYVNFVSSNNGFTLADVFMYNDKHNEDNGEENSDGDNWNFSSNYGVEGPTRKKYIADLRKRQWKNALAMLFMAQGVPLLWSGDEFGNSQQGNNNAYCQDNSIGWVNWRSPRFSRPYLDFVKKLSAFRREHPMIAQQDPFRFSDYRTYGFPDLSYHGDHAWISHVDYGKMNIGMMYSGAYAPKGASSQDVYVAFNFYSEGTRLALPKLSKKRKWHLVMNTALDDSWLKEPEKCANQQYITVETQSICILVGK